MAEVIRALHVVAGIEDQSAGTSYCVPRLCEALARHGDEVTLLSVGASYRDEERGFLDRRFEQDLAGVPVAGALRLSGGLTGAMIRAAPAADIVHSHGLWLMPMIRSGALARRLRKPAVISPHGMLGGAALEFSKAKKAIFRLVFQQRALRDAACLHATSRQEYDDIRAAGLKNPLAVIANGIDLPDAAGPLSPRGGARTILALGRIHPKKGLDTLIRAWARLEGKHPDWALRIVGPSERGHAEALLAIADAARLKRVSIEGPLYSADKLAAYRAAELFVLPSLNENFAMTVAEALAAGTPVVCTRGAPWAGLDENGCGWWIDPGVDAVAAALAAAMRLPPEELARKGARGRDWMARDFTWDAIAARMHAVYQWLLGKGGMPDSVRLE